MAELNGFVRYHATVSVPFVVRDEDAEKVLVALHSLLTNNVKWCCGQVGALAGQPMVSTRIAQEGEGS